MAAQNEATKRTAEIKEGKAEENKAPENEISERLEKAEMDARPDIDRPTTLRKAFTSARQ